MQLILHWVLGLGWLALGFILLRTAYWADWPLWKTILGYGLGGIILLGGVAFILLAMWITWPIDHDVNKED